MISIAFETLFDTNTEGSGQELTSGIHSGNAGDLIFSLPTVRALSIKHLILNVHSSTQQYRAFSEETTRNLVPLLMHQEYIERVSIVRCGLKLEGLDPALINVDFNLDDFRNQDLSQLHLMAAHARAFKVEIDPNVPFLSVPDQEGHPEPSDDVIMSFTPRYRVLSDEFVRALVPHFNFRRALIVGIPGEWREIAGIPGTVRKCKDLLEMACLIKRSGLFMGNQSLPAAIAEGLKAPRILDIPQFSNAFPIGPLGFVFPVTIGELTMVVRYIQDGRNIKPVF